MTPAFVVALLGAESTGKTALSLGLAERLAQQGYRVQVVPETLREFCDRHGRTPMAHEQRDILRVHAERIALARQQAEVVVADTSGLMTAVYSAWCFGDTSLDEEAVAHHRAVDLTLLTALDLPWVADGLQRDGAHVRAPVDTRLRALLTQAGLPYALVAGQGTARLESAWASVHHALLSRAAQALPASASGQRARWRWVCEGCDDADCERHWLPRGAPEGPGQPDPQA